MVDPSRSHRSSLSSRVALAAALLLAGSFGLLATFMVPPQVQAKRQPVPEIASPPAVLVSPARDLTDVEPSFRPITKPAPEELIAFCSDHVTENRSFVIFQNGTCVVVNEPSLDPIGDARERLLACEDPEARFVPELTQDGDLMISFKEPVFHNFTAAQRAELEVSLTHLTPTLLTPKEKASAGDDWVPPSHAQFGLLARRRMLEDAADPKPVKIIRAKGRATVQN